MPVFDSLSVILGTFFVVCAFVFALVHTQKKETEEEKSEKETKHQKITDTFTRSEQPEIDIFKMMKFNMEEINDFIAMSKHQSKRAFEVAIASFVFGLLLFGAAVICAILSPSSTGVISLSICGAITELLSGGNMVIYNKAQDQLNNYYHCLHENERFLSAVKIVEYITRENRDNAIAEIIQRQMCSPKEKQS